MGVGEVGVQQALHKNVRLHGLVKNIASEH